MKKFVIVNYLVNVTDADIVEKQMVESYRIILRLALIENGKLNKDELLPENLVPVIKPG